MDTGRPNSRNAGLPAQRTGDRLTGHGIAATVGTGWNQSGGSSGSSTDRKRAALRRIAATQQQKKDARRDPRRAFLSLRYGIDRVCNGYAYGMRCGFPPRSERRQRRRCAAALQDQPGTTAAGGHYLRNFRKKRPKTGTNCAFCILNCAKLLFGEIRERKTKAAICTQIRAFSDFRALKVRNSQIIAILL